MRAGCILGILVFLATPNAKLVSGNYATLFVMSVASNTLANCCLAAVSTTEADESVSVTIAPSQSDVFVAKHSHLLC